MYIIYVLSNNEHFHSLNSSIKIKGKKINFNTFTQLHISEIKKKNG